MATLDEISNAILSWAQINGVLADNIPIMSPGKISLVPFKDEAPDYFRSRKVVRVDKDENTGTIILYSRLPIAKTKQKLLISSFAEKYSGQNISLRLDATKPFRIDHTVDSYGNFKPLNHFNGRICCGSSVGIGNQRNAGTLMALARKKGAPNELYGISCNHVVGGCSTTRPGTPIVVPGIQDVDENNNEITVIGDLESAAHMGQGLPSIYDASLNRDLAYFKIRDPDLVCSLQGEGNTVYDTPTLFAKPVLDMPVKKWGRSTGLTKGEISQPRLDNEYLDYNVQSFYGPMNSQYFKGTVYFHNVIEVMPSGRPFSLGGDSGALVVTDYTNKVNRVVGMVIAGGRNKSLVLPIAVVLKELGLTLLANHHT